MSQEGAKMKGKRFREEQIIAILKEALEARQSKPFYLKPSDIVYVPEKFSWF